MSQAAMTLSERADELEEQMMHELNQKIATKSVLFGMADGKVEIASGNDLLAKNPGKYFLMGADKRLPEMPEKPTLIDFFQRRFASTAHLLQSAKHALKNGLPEKTILACLLHDIGVVSFIRCDHGYWGAQLIEPYVDEEVSWAIRMHQALRFFPDESVGYKYPDQYIKLFGPEYRPEPYIEEAYKRARNHKWVHDVAHDHGERHLFVRSQRKGRARGVHRHHRPQLPAAEGRPRLGQHPSSHMWRTINWPTRFCDRSDRLRHGRGCPGHPRLQNIAQRRECPRRRVYAACASLQRGMTE
jgi:hypothetical protein